MQPASHPGNGDLSPAFVYQSKSARRRDVLLPVAVPAPLCGWWYRGRYEKWARRGTTARAFVRCSVPSPTGDRVRGTAGRALARHRTLTVTVVAAQMVLRLMQRVVVIATWAFGNPATVVAQQCRRKATAVKKENDLGLSACKCWRIRVINAGARPACTF